MSETKTARSRSLCDDTHDVSGNLVPRRGAPRIYFVRCGDFVKIGTSTQMLGRISSMRTNSPYEIEVLGSVAGGVEFERRLHKRFSKQHHRGEWFRLDTEMKSELSIMISYRSRPEVVASIAAEDPYDRGARLGAERMRLARLEKAARRQHVATMKTERLARRKTI